MDKSLITIAETTLSLLVKKSWNVISLDEIYKKTKLSKKIFDKKITNKKHLLTNINRYFDFKVSRASKKIERSNSKDMIFELIMIRFDILQNYRNSIINIFNAFKEKPKQLLFLLPSFIESMILMANLSGIPCKGFNGGIKIKALLIVYFSSFLIWTKDKSTSLEKTMTSLDNNLNRAVKFAKLFN